MSMNAVLTWAGHGLLVGVEGKRRGDLGGGAVLLVAEESEAVMLVAHDRAHDRILVDLLLAFRRRFNQRKVLDSLQKQREHISVLITKKLIKYVSEFWVWTVA